MNKQVELQRKLINEILKGKFSETVINIVNTALDISYLSGIIDKLNDIKYDKKTQEEKFFDAVPNISNEYIIKQ